MPTARRKVLSLLSAGLGMLPGLPLVCALGCDGMSDKQSKAIFGTGPKHGGYRLEKAIMVMRHGVRAPCCSSEMTKWSGKRWPVWVEPDGEMTSHGRAGIVAVGRYMAAYFDRTGLLPKERSLAEEAVFVSASHIPRARESARALMAGMLPDYAFNLREAIGDRVFFPVKADVSLCDTVRMQQEIDAAVGTSLTTGAERYERDFKALEAVVGKPLPPANASPSQDASLPHRLTAASWRKHAGSGHAGTSPLHIASEMVETFRMQYANNLPLDQVAFGHVRDRATLDALSPLQTLNYALSVDRPYGSACRGSQMMDEIARGLDDTRPGNSRHHAASLQVYSGHDTNIAALRTMLGFAWHTPGALYNDIAPGMTLLFERWAARESGSAGRRFVRLAYISPTLDQLRHATALTDRHPPVQADFEMEGGFHVDGVGYLIPQADFIDRLRRAIDPGAIRAVDYSA